MYSRVKRFLNLNDIYPSLARCWPVYILISVFKVFCDVLTAELSISTIKSKGPSLNWPPLLSREWRFSGFSFTSVCIEPAGPDLGLYAVLQD